MYTPQVLSRRSFSIAKLLLSQSDSAWKSTALYDELVQLRWDDLVRNTKTRVWDGTYYRVLNPEAFQNNLATPILLGSIPYRYIATFPFLAQQHASFALDPLNHLSTIALIRTADRFYVFGIRTRSGTVDLIGGGAQYAEMPILSGVDLEENLCKELSEETGLEPADVDDLAGIGVLLSSTSNVLVVGRVHLRLNSVDVERRFQHRRDDEMNRLLFVDQAKVRKFLSEMHDYRTLLAELEW